MHDRNLVMQTTARFDGKAAACMEYSIIGGIEGIALTSTSDHGFVNSRLFTTLSGRYIDLSSGIMRFTFSRQSGKILEVETWLREDNHVSPLCPNTSVVSLDVHGTIGVKKIDTGMQSCLESVNSRANCNSNDCLENCNDGPGMII